MGTYLLSPHKYEPGFALLRKLLLPTLNIKLHGTMGLHWGFIGIMEKKMETAI